MKCCFGNYDGYSDGCIRCNDYDCIVKTKHNINANMNTEQIKNALDSLIELYKLMENEYGVDLTNQVNHVQIIHNDIHDAIWLCEHK